MQQRFEELAAQFPDQGQALQQYRSNPQFRRQMESAVLEDQVIDWIAQRAKVSEMSASFKEIMNFGA